MSRTIKIPGRLESAETGNVVAGANTILDDTNGKKQNVINQETDAELLRLDQEKQGNLTFDQTPTENSMNPVTSGGVYAADQLLSQAIEAILLLIPSAASALNKLVDLATMNSSISTATASFKGTYNLVSDLHLTVSATHAQIAAALDALSLGADNNDYAFVQVPNTDLAPTDIKKTERYKFNGTNWAYEYDLNNSGFTSVQWAAINSNITAILVSKLSALPTNEALMALLAAKQDNLTFDDAPTSGSNNPVTSGGINTRNNEIIAMITALDAAKQDVLTFDTTPTENSTNPVTSNGVYQAIYLVQAALAALDGRMLSAEHSIDLLTEDVGVLRTLYQALSQSDIIVGAKPATGVANTVYRVPGTSTYADWMYYNGAWVKLAEYTTLDGYLYKGIATPTGSPAASAVKMFYFASTVGTYTNYGGLVVQSVPSILKYDGVNWSQDVINTGEGVFDISVYNAVGGVPQTYSGFDTAVTNANVPLGFRKGGMSVKFIQSSDHKYVQYRLMNQNWSTTITDWQGVDDEPTAGSDNLVKSGGVALQSIKNLSANINGILLPLPTIYQKGIDDGGNYTNSDAWCSSQIVYLRKGTIIDVTNSNYRIFVRRWESIISYATCEKIGYIDIFPYVLPADGYYGFAFIHLNNAAITVAEVESNYSLSYPAAKTTDNTPLICVGDYVSINSANQLRNIFWKRSANNKNYILSIPFNKGSKAELAISASGIQTRYALKKNGTQLTNNTWDSSFRLYNFIYDCDTIDVYFRLYDGSSGSVFDTSSINTIIGGISSIDIQTRNYQDDIPFASEQYVKMLNEQVEKNSHANILLGNEVSDIVPIESMTYNNDGTLNVNSSFSSIYPIYLPFGAKLAFTSPLTHLYVRAYRNSVTQANLVVSQYVDNGFECPFSGWYLLTFRKSNGYPSSSEITNNFAVLNRGIANNYNKHNVIELNKSLGTLISDNKVLEFIFPAKQFFMAKVLLNTGNNVQVYVFYEKDGTILSGESSFGLGWDYEGYGIICEKECDNIHIRLRIYDGTSLSTLTDTEITTIINSIKLLHVQTYDYKQTVGTDAQYYLQDSKYKLCRNNIKSICHQGLYHYSLAGGYYAAALAGFDYGETDVQMTSDNIPVCCHDDTFVDENTQNTITISQHTLAELKTYNYHGGKIASLEEILRECKTSGIGLALDQTNTSSVEFTETIKLLKKYNMTNNVIWIASGTAEGITGWCSHLYAALPNAVVELLLSNIDSETIQLANSLNNDGHKIIISFNKDAISVQQLIAVSENINAEIEKSMWIINRIEDYESYFPFVNYITSDCLSYGLYIQGFGIENLP